MTDQRSPCCDAELVMTSPPNNYECRECYAEYDLDDDPFDEAVDGASIAPADAADEDAELCGVEMSDGSTCERPAGECPYHGQETEA